jgi:hypothetical protein
MVNFAMEGQRAQSLEKLRSSSRLLTVREQEKLNAFLDEHGFFRVDLDDVISTERIRAQAMHVVRSGALLTRDRDNGAHLAYESARTTPHLRRRWSADLYEAQGQDGDGVVHDNVERDFVLENHKLSTSELADEKTVYLETERAEIRNNTFGQIDHIGEWFYDETIDIGLDAIYRILGCEYQDIAILGTGFAWELYMIGRNKNPALEPTKQLQEKIGKGQFTIIPINNGWKAMHGGVKSAGALGSHWTVLVIDCHRPAIHTRHYDSDNRGVSTKNTAAALEVLRGFSQTYAQTRPDYKMNTETLEINFHREAHCPNQTRDNQCKADSSGACGPFVWAFTKDIVQYIVECREDAQRLGSHVEVDITLPAGFAQRWGWDSGATRKSLKNLLRREQRSRIRLIGTHGWWGTKEKPGWKDWLAGRKAWISSDYFWDPWHGL